MSKHCTKKKFDIDTQTVILNSLRKGNFRVTACKEANISPSLLSLWMRNPIQEYKDFAKKVIEIEAQVESRAVNKILEAGDKDAKWYAWYLERRHKHWNGAVHRWELQVLQRQLKQLKGIIDELSANQASSEIDSSCLLPQANPYQDYSGSN